MLRFLYMMGDVIRFLLHSIIIGCCIVARYTNSFKSNFVKICSVLLYSQVILSQRIFYEMICVAAFAIACEDNNSQLMEAY